MRSRDSKIQENKNKLVAPKIAHRQHANGASDQIIDSRPEALAQRTLKDMACYGSRLRKLKSFQSQADKNQYAAQGFFTSEGKKQNEIDNWVTATIAQLKRNDEVLLLKYFNYLQSSKKAREWDIGKHYNLTRFRLWDELGRREEAPNLTILDEDNPVERLTGERSAHGYKRLAAWDLEDRGAIDPSTHTEFAHVSHKAEWMKNRIDTQHGADSGELGPGFYSVGGHNDIGAKAIRDEFGKNGKVPRDVLKFRIANDELGHLVNDNQELAGFLIYILQHADGYPPDCNAISLIERINKIGKVLIFPDKDTEVDIGTDKRYSYETYRAANGGAGNHSLIIGPQARDALDGIRQICARGYLGDKIMNEALRSESRLGKRGT